MSEERIYLDNAATTQVSPEVLSAMVPCFSNIYGNPSSVHGFGRDAKMMLDIAREKVANAIGAKKTEIYFTGGGSESDNWAIKGTAIANAGKGRHIITSAIEHHAVLHACAALEKQGYSVTYLPVDKEGFVDPEDVKKAIRPDTILVTIMMANNEIGTIEPVEEIGKICREAGVYFHTDAVQAVGNMHIDVAKMNIDMLSLSAHKFHGPKGVGALYIRNGVKIANLIDGGAQERSKRAGTENLPSIVGLGKAIEVATRDIDTKIAYESALRDKLLTRIVNEIPETRINGPLKNRLPGNANVCIKYIEGEGMLLMLDMQGIAASSGSACTSGSLDPSHVLLAIGLDHETAHGSLRLSLSSLNTEEEIDKTVDVLKASVERLRSMSPLYNKAK
ncbi:MAG: cysteine desulfurase NifS [Clostridiales bacterium]|nr:cysteine desulfurase NifS [Clostridiales bacterium]MBQ4637536.1 cysteine desulfurase NifS [Clostridia bacterium]